MERIAAAAASSTSRLASASARLSPSHPQGSCPTTSSLDPTLTRFGASSRPHHAHLKALGSGLAPLDPAPTAAPFLSAPLPIPLVSGDVPSGVSLPPRHPTGPPALTSRQGSPALRSAIRAASTR